MIPINNIPVVGFDTVVVISVGVEVVGKRVVVLDPDEGVVSVEVK